MSTLPAVAFSRYVVDGASHYPVSSIPLQMSIPLTALFREPQPLAELFSASASKASFYILFYFLNVPICCLNKNCLFPGNVVLDLNEDTGISVLLS